MRWAYVIGPLTLVPLLGAFFLVPRPHDDGLRFDRASLSLLVCHGPAGGFVASTRDDPVAPAGPEDGGLWVRLKR
jgi:hypothetical protein